MGVAGSARKGGNTRLFVEETLRAVAGRAETRLVALDADAPPVEEIVALLEAADGLLLGTPSYFGMPSAELKRVLDATWDLAKRRSLAGKAGIALAVEAASGGELAAASLGHFFTVHRMAYLGSVVGKGVKEREILYDVKAIREARDLANRLVDFVERGKGDGAKGGD